MKSLERLLQSDSGISKTAYFPSDLHEAARHIVKILLDDEPLTEGSVNEATVHRPRRSQVWVATFTGPTGGQVWRTTGLTDRQQALLLAKTWEAEARAQRLSLGRSPRKPTLRVRGHEPGTAWSGPLTQKEVAMLLNMSERGVREIERRAFQKLLKHPMLREVWQKYLAGELDEEDFRLTAAEIEALYSLAQTPTEDRLSEKVLRLTQLAK